MSTQSKNPSTPLRVFYSYAREDEPFIMELDKHLGALSRQGLIASWFDQQLSPGADWSKEINNRLQTADIVLLLVSADFMLSDYINQKELQVALKRHELGEARVIPIILRPIYWENAPFAKIPVLPHGGLPVSEYKNQDEAFRDIASGIKQACEDILAKKDDFYRSVELWPPSQKKYSLPQVFVRSGVPKITFVEPEDFALLKLALQQPGRVVIIEGPSGIGKTTTIAKMVEDLEKDVKNSHLSRVSIVSARNPSDRAKLQTIRDWHKETVILDDFHRLDIDLRLAMVDYLKELADSTSTTKKLAIIGIPRTGRALVDISFDLASRIDVFTLGKAQDELILQMIEKGEEALNVKFDRKSEIVLTANGSFNLAQFLCFNLCASTGINETQEQTQFIYSDIDAVKEQLTTVLESKFGRTIRQFIALGGPRDLTCLHLLEELVLKENGSLSLSELKDSNPQLIQGVDTFIAEKWMEKLYDLSPWSENYLFFDSERQLLLIDDPQLRFYLNQVNLADLARESGKTTMLARRKVFISYSLSDTKWLNRLRVHLAPIEREGIIDLWDDTKIAAGQLWREAIREALESAQVAVLLVSANFLASDFIIENELPALLARANAGGTKIIPVILSPSLFTSTDLSMFQSINSPAHPISGMSTDEQEKIFFKVAQSIMERFTEA